MNADGSVSLNDAAAIVEPLGWDDQKKAEEAYFNQANFAQVFDTEEHDDADLHRHLDATER